uniref:Uncharacterized protein n=1 Tax=uncultured marine virus TaxID=186617 RepID=A0A0F7L5D9_9VIRU|nr:hypothetical protein [uncultured marine virus]
MLPVTCGSPSGAPEPSSTKPKHAAMRVATTTASMLPSRCSSSRSDCARAGSPRVWLSRVRRARNRKFAASTVTRPVLASRFAARFWRSLSLTMWNFVGLP